MNVPIETLPADSKAKKILRRCVGGAVAIAILVAIVLVDGGQRVPWIAVCLATLLGIAGANELFTMLEAGGMRTRRGLVTLAAIALLLTTAATATGDDLEVAAAAVFGGWLLVAFGCEVVAGEPRAGIERVAFGAVGLGYVWLYSFLIVLLMVPPIDSYAGVTPRGVHLALWLVFVSKSNDIGGYLIGNWIGGRKLAPRVSPGKTWAGSVGGVCLSLLAALAGASWIRVDLSTIEIVGFALLVSVATQFGDLAESLLKRACRVKDSGRLLPTFGGALDVIDSLVFAAPVGYAFLRVAGALS